MIKPLHISQSSRNFNILNGHEPLPSHMKIAHDCPNQHGKDGQTVRYKKSGACIVCHGQQTKHSDGVRKFKPRNKAALDMYEDIANSRFDDFDPLFD